MNVSTYYINMMLYCKYCSVIYRGRVTINTSYPICDGKEELK